MNPSFAWVFAVVALQRLFELIVSRRNRRVLEALGGRELYPESFRRVAALHGLFFAALLAESYPWRVPLDALTIVCLAVLFILSAVRYWCMASLGKHWNVRIVVVPGGQAKRSGPYRYVRHPNYLAVALEFLFLPILMRAPATMAVFFLANIAVLRQRIRLEEKALRELTDYGNLFATH
ncbi:MAG: isoprenylcysteine carboxyl methyltransferase family protein [Deltaproteobacteria bacterium]